MAVGRGLCATDGRGLCTVDGRGKQQFYSFLDGGLIESPSGTVQARYFIL